MKSNQQKSYIMLLGFFLFLSILINNNLIQSTQNCKISKLNKKCLNSSEISQIIHIDGDSGWFDFKEAGKCSGNGTFYNPYILKNLIINCTGSEFGIWIENSNVYFKIVNCSIYGTHSSDGILLSNISNAQLINNNCSFNSRGIYVEFSCDTIISRNTVNNNKFGIDLTLCGNNIISENIVNDNERDGINIFGKGNNTILRNIGFNNYAGMVISNENKNTISGNNLSYNSVVGISIQSCYIINISKNTANYNKECGIYLRKSSHNIILRNNVSYNNIGIFLDDSDFNSVSGNTLIGNNNCIREDHCYGNSFKDNGSCNYPPDKQLNIGYIVFALLGIGFIITIILVRKLERIYKSR